MIGCDYNGWTDVPEEERESMDQYPELSWCTAPLDSRGSAEGAPEHGSTVEHWDTKLAA